MEQAQAAAAAASAAAAAADPLVGAMERVDALVRSFVENLGGAVGAVRGHVAAEREQAGAQFEAARQALAEERAALEGQRAEFERAKQAAEEALEAQRAQIAAAWEEFEARRETDKSERAAAEATWTAYRTEFERHEAFLEGQRVAQVAVAQQAQSLVHAAATPATAVGLPHTQTPLSVSGPAPLAAASGQAHEQAPPEVEAMVAWLSGGQIFLPQGAPERAALRAEAERAGAAPLIAAIDAGHVGTLAPAGAAHAGPPMDESAAVLAATPAPALAPGGRPTPQQPPSVRGAETPPVALLALGGLARANSPLDSCERLDVRSGQWTQLSPLPFARGYHSAAANPEGTRAWVAGGSDGKVTLGDVVELNLQARGGMGDWRPVAPMPTPRIWLGLCYLGDRLAALGGYDGTNYLAATELFNPATHGGGQWTRVRDMPCGGRAQLGVGSLDGVLYAAGGFCAPNYLNVVEAYDPRSDQWWGVAPMLKPRRDLGMAACGGMLVACGGYDGKQSLCDVEGYDPRTRGWRALAPMRHARQLLGVSAVGCTLYAVGGFDGRAAVPVVEEYDARRDAWREVQPMAEPRLGLAVACI